MGPDDMTGGDACRDGVYLSFQPSAELRQDLRRLIAQDYIEHLVSAGDWERRTNDAGTD